MDINDLYKLVFSNKAKILLEKSRTISQITINPEMEQHVKPEILNEIINKELMMNLSKLVLKNFSMHIKDENKNDNIKTKSIDLMVIPTDSFKIVVEEVVRLMPQKAIDEIRRGVNID